MRGALVVITLPEAIGYSLAFLLFLLALRGAMSSAGHRMTSLLGATGIALSAATAAYIHDASALPEMLGAGLGGCIAGFFIARMVARSAALPLIAAFLALAGLAIPLFCLAALRNPSALGLSDGITMQVDAFARTEMALAVVLGAIVLSGSALVVSGLAPVSLPMRRIIVALALLLSALFLRDFALGQVDASLVGVIALSMVAGLGIAAPVDRPAWPALLCFFVACLGWSAALLGFALAHVFMVATGGLTGTAGLSLACRLMTARKAALQPL